MVRRQSLALQLFLFSVATAGLVQIHMHPPSTPYYASGEIELVLVSDKVTWDQAYEACRTVVGGTLARMDTRETNIALKIFENSDEGSDHPEDSWIGLYRGKIGAHGQRDLVWSDDCHEVERLLYDRMSSKFNSRTSEKSCYRINSDYQWEARDCQELNSFICERRRYPYGGYFTRVRGSGMMVVSKAVSQECSAVCNMLYGCYRVSDLTATSCAVDIVSEVLADVESHYKPVLIETTVLNLTQSVLDQVVMMTLKALPELPSDSVCDPQLLNASDRLISLNDFPVPEALGAVEPCPSQSAIETLSCPIAQPSTSTLVQTATIVDTVTSTLRVSIAPTTVTYTDTVTMTTQLYSSSVPREITEVTTLTFTQTVSASTQACSTATPAYNISSKHMDEVISSLVSELTVDGRSTSRSKARYTSAPDDRMSCRAMGSVALGFILVVLLFIVAADASAWLRYI